MRFLFFTVAVFYLSNLQGQQEFFPTGIVMKPIEVFVAESLQDSISRYQLRHEINADFVKKFIPPNLPSNWRIIREHELAILKDQDFSSFLSLAVCREINHILLPNNSNLLIYCSNDSVQASTPLYKKILLTHKVNWMVNLHKIRLEQNNGRMLMTVAVQAYYQPTGYLMLNSTATVTQDQVKQTCETDLLSCMVTEMVNQLSLMVTDKINRVR